MGVRFITNVPPARAAAYARILKDSGASSVSQAPESDGEVTLIVVFPDHQHANDLNVPED